MLRAPVKTLGSSCKFPMPVYFCCGEHWVLWVRIVQRTDGTAQALRNMVEMSAIELIGRLQNLPY